MLLESVREWVRSNPVRVRAALAAVVGWLTHHLPQIKEYVGSDELVGVLMGLVTLALGESASRRVAVSKAAARTAYNGQQPN